MPWFTVSCVPGAACEPLGVRNRGPGPQEGKTWSPAWAELSLIHSGCGENMEGLEEKRLSLGELGMTL